MLGGYVAEGIGNYLVIPFIALIGGAIILLIKQQVDRAVKSFVAKNEIANMEKKNAIRLQLTKTIEEHVEAAVASNMQLADEMKKSGQKLEEYQIMQLNESAKTLVLNSLPPSLTEEDGVLLEIIGGRDRLDAIISSMMEKYVYQYKAKHPPGAAELLAAQQYSDSDEPVG